ncbi:hypothetical protein HPB49_016889 [Dermacentor silvarum]|uniref:Uncharacterized protein n=1 Tax=Dermacentor silvarum TaxID=543639 RepID=A0ACB8CAD7_DERSI|nr:hypothetical protein HPB49_016889 [Dermacentor silvarum]
MTTFAIFLLLIIRTPRMLEAAHEGSPAQSCAFPAGLVRDVTVNVLRASHAVLYFGERAHPECTFNVSRTLHGSGVTILSTKHAAAKDAATPETLENSLGACRLLVVTPLEGDQTVFDVKRTQLLSENCTKLSTYSQWNDKTGFDKPVSPLELSPVVRNYWRRKLLVGYVEVSARNVSRRPRPNGALVYEGVDFSLIFNLANAFNMSLVPVRDPEATWGAKRHGRWTGIAGMVSRREVDLAVSASFQTPYREEVLDYAHYYYIQVVKFIVRAPAEKPRALVIVRPFAVEVWLGVLVAYLVSLVLLLAVMRFERRHDRTGKLRFLPTGDVALSLYLGVIWQGTIKHLPHPPRH